METDASINPRSAGPEREATAHGAFQAVAARYSSAIALSAGGCKITYRELDEASNRLARILRSDGVEPGGLVAIGGGRSLEAIIAWLAALKAGAAYLPIDPDLPAKSRDAILAASRPALVLAGEGEKLDDAIRRSQGESAAPLAAQATGESPAYVMFTSGTTGRPKGVVIPHRGILRLVRGQTYARLDASTVILQLAAPSFDASTFEVYGALLNGGRLEIYDQPAVSLDRIAAAATAGGVNTLWLTAGLFHLFAEAGIGKLSGLRQLLSGGDVLSSQHLRMAMAALPGCRFVNGYGPTENTTFTCCYPIPPEGWGDGPVPIGRPIAGTTVHILGDDGAPAPEGEAGMLWTGGAGVALGYLNEPELTAERFRPDPFAGGGLMYRTGDLVRQRPDGAIEFLGRRDREIKIDGKRLNLDEVETLLRADPRIEEAYVVTVEATPSVKRVTGFVRLRDAAPPGFSASLRRELALAHPPHALPNEIVVVERFALNPNGKVDRQALSAQAARPRSMPVGGPDGRIAAIFGEILGTDAVDVGRSFFDIGMTSLMMARAQARIAAETGRSIDIAELFSCASIAELAQRIARRDDAPSAGLVEAARERAMRRQAAMRRFKHV